MESSMLRSVQEN
jgi:hypothetical protein